MFYLIICLTIKTGIWRHQSRDHCLLNIWFVFKVHLVGRWPIKDIKTQLFILGNLKVKVIISGLGFYFHTYKFFLRKSPSFLLILEHFLKLRFFENSGFLNKKNMFSKLRFYFVITQNFFKLRFFSKPSFLLSWKMHMSYTCWPRLLAQRKWTWWHWWSKWFYLFYALWPFR